MDSILMMILGTALFGAADLLQDPPVADPDWQFVVTGIEANRRQVRSGEVEIESRKFIDGKEFGSEPGRLYLAFDAQKNRWRLDRDEPGWVYDPKGPSTEDPKHPGVRVFEANILGRITTKFFRREDAAASWRSGVGGGVSIGIHRPDKLRGPSRLFDPRALGLYVVTTFEEGGLIDETLEWWRRQPFRVHVRPEQGTWTCTLRVTTEQGAIVERNITVDPQAGFTVTRHDVGGAFVEQPLDFRRNQLMEVRWARKDDVWVPVWHRMSRFGSNPEEKLLEVNEWNLTWLSVNKDLPDELFSVEGFKAPEELGIVDFRMGQPVVLRQAKGYETAAAHIAAAAKRSRWRAVVASVALLSFVAIIAVVALRRRRTIVRPTL